MSKFPANLKRCYYSDCKNVCSGRPCLSKRVDLSCALESCNNTKRGTSKYCSDECRKKFARKRYVERLKKKNGVQY